MKLFTLILIFVSSLSIKGQTEIVGRIIDPNTGTGISDIFMYLLKDDDKWISVMDSDSLGFFRAKLRDNEISEESKYEIEISSSGFISKRTKIDIFRLDTIVIKIYADSSFKPNKPHLFYSNCTSTSYGYYYPSEPLSLSEIPNFVKNKLESHIVNRIGKTYYQKLEFFGGQIVDIDRLHIVEENSRNYRWTPHTYNLCFSLSDPEKGIGSYVAQIALDSLGNVKEELTLPDTRKFPEKENLISLDSAKAVISNKINLNNLVRTELIYLKKHDSLGWIFYSKEDKNRITNTYLIDAHNGKFIEKGGYQSID